MRLCGSLVHKDTLFSRLVLCALSWLVALPPLIPHFSSSHMDVEILRRCAPSHAVFSGKKKKRGATPGWEKSPPTSHKVLRKALTRLHKLHLCDDLVKSEHDFIPISCKKDPDALEMYRVYELDFPRASQIPLSNEHNTNQCINHQWDRYESEDCAGRWTVMIRVKCSRKCRPLLYSVYCGTTLVQRRAELLWDASVGDLSERTLYILEISPFSTI